MQSVNPGFSLGEDGLLTFDTNCELQVLRLICWDLNELLDSY